MAKGHLIPTPLAFWLAVGGRPQSNGLAPSNIDVAPAEIGMRPDLRLTMNRADHQRRLGQIEQRVRNDAKGQAGDEPAAALLSWRRWIHWQPPMVMVGG